MTPMTQMIRWLARPALSVLFALALGAGGIAALAEPPKAGFAPDPPGHASVKQWVFDIRVQHGTPIIEKTRAGTVARPVESPRVMGRYAIELYIGPELLDRVRFNVPLASDLPESGDTPRNPFHRPTFDAVSTQVRVQIADHDRATYMALVDRATGSVERFDWPPEADGRLIRRVIAQPAGSSIQLDAGSLGDAGLPIKNAAPVDGGGPPDVHAGRARR